MLFFKRALVICSLMAPLAIVPIATANAGTASASDNFARANGSLGPNWTNMADGGLTIVNQQVQGTNSGGDSGDIRTAETYSSDQSSQVQLTSTPVTGNQWVGPAVRQAGGADVYVGIYFANFGSPKLMLFLRNGGAWGRLGASVPVSPLAAGTTLSLSVTGSTLTFADNGTTAITATDTTLTGGAPGIMANGLATATNWSGTGVTTTTLTTTTAPTTTTTKPATTTTTKPTTTTTTKAARQPPRPTAGHHHDDQADDDDHHQADDNHHDQAGHHHDDQADHHHDDYDHNAAEQHHDYRSRHDHDYLRGWGLGQRALGQLRPG